MVEGDGAVYSTGGRAARGLTVQIVDETGKPVSLASVSFRLPAEGPSGTFASGTRTEIVTTKPDGLATVWGMQWNRMPGPVTVRITASKGAARAGLLATVHLSDTLPRGAAAVAPGRPGRRWLWITVLAAAGAGGAVAASGFRGGGSAAPAPAALRLGTPSVGIGRP
jgi:hypothetical protein